MRLGARGWGLVAIGVLVVVGCGGAVWAQGAATAVPTATATMTPAPTMTPTAMPTVTAVPAPTPTATLTMLTVMIVTPTSSTGTDKGGISGTLQGVLIGSAITFSITLLIIWTAEQKAKQGVLYRVSIWKRAFLGFLLLLFLGALGMWLLTLDPNVIAAIIAAFGSVLLLVYSKQHEQQKSIEESQREKKKELYEQFVKTMITQLISYTKKTGGLPPDEFSKYLQDFAQSMIVWGSEETLHKYLTYKRIVAAYAQDPSSLEHGEIFFSLEDVLLAIRSDLGHSNDDLDDGDLLSLFMTDLDKYLPRYDSEWYNWKNRRKS